MKNFKLKSILLLLAFVLSIGQVAATDLYLRGIYSKDGSSGDPAWNSDNSNKMTGSSSPWSIIVHLTGSTTYSFKISDSSWSYPNTYEANNTNATVTLGTAYSTWHNGGKGNLQFTPSVSGFYKFTLSSESLTITRHNPIPSAAAPSAVVSGTNAMFYIQGYPDVNYNVLRASSTHSIDANSTGITKGVGAYSYVNTAKSNLSTNDYVSNNPSSWAGVENTGIKTANGGELFVANASTSTTAAKTASTSASVTGEVLSISTTTNATTGVLNGSMYIQYYIDGSFTGVTYSASTASYASIPAGGATARASTYNVSGLSNGSHTLKTVLTDGIIYWVADTDEFTVAHTYSIKLHDNNGDTNSGSATATYNSNTLSSITDPTKTGYNVEGYYTSSNCTTKVATAAGVLQNSITVSEVVWTNSSGAWQASSNQTFYTKWQGNTHTVTLNKGDGSLNGEATATYDASSISITTTPFYKGYTVEGYYLSDGTTKVVNADGTLVKNVSSYTSNDETPVWIYDDDCTLYTHWTVVAATYTLTFGVGSKYTSHGSVSATVGGSSPASSGSAYNENSTIRVTASPNTGYRVMGWYKEAACTNEITGTGAPGTASSFSFTLTKDTTIYVAFEQSKTTITLDGNTGTSGDASVIATHGSALPSFTKHTKSGYTLNGYYTATSGGSKIINADGTLAASTSYTDASSHWNSDERTLTLHAQWTENTVTLTPTVSYDAGSSSYTASASNSIGVTTDSQIKCSKPNSSHYTFAGWTLTNLTVTSGTASTDTIIRVKVTTPGSPVSAVAKYNEVLTQSTWVLKGGKNLTGDNWSTEHAMSKKSGESTSDVVYYTCNISKTHAYSSSDNSYSFKIVKKGASDVWYGLGSGEGEWGYYSNFGEETMTTSSNNVQIVANAVGEYVIKLDYSNLSSPKVTVEFPSQFIKGKWDDWTEHAFDKDGIYRVSLPASTTYEFCVNYKSTIYKKTKTITATTYDETFNTSDNNCKLTTGAAGIYTFGWNGTDKKLSVIFPGDTAKSMFSKDEYIYFDTRRLGSTTGWNQAAFSSRFWVKYYASGVDYDHIDCAIADTVEQGIYYVKLPTDRLGQIQINRMATDFSSIYNTAAKVYAFDRSATTKNCLIEQTGHENDWNDWQPQWSSTTYCPPMKTAVLEDNGTTILAGGGTKANPYQIAASSKIKVTAASSTAFNDDVHMTHKYHFYNGAESLSDQTGATYELTASASTNETYKIVVKPYNTYNSQSSTKRIKSDTIYYKTVPSYTITYDANGAHSGTVPVDGNRYISGATPTALSNSGSLAKEGYTFNGWNDGNGTSYAVDAVIEISSEDVVLYAVWADDHNYYFHGGDDGTGTAWNTAANWTKGAVPNDIANTIYIMKPVEIPADATIKAAAVNIVTGGTYTRPHNRGTVDAAGHLSINGGGGLIISGALSRVESATALSTTTNTREEDLYIGSTKAKGNGVLIMGTHTGTNQAIVEFYTKSHGEVSGDRNYAINQFIGTPFNDCNDITYNYHNSWVYGVDYTGTPTWKRVNGGEGMNAFEGYNIISADEEDHVYWMGGTLVASTNQSLSLHHNSSTTTENLLANSWMGPIVIGAFQASDFTNCAQTIYIFNAGSPNDRSGDQFGNAANNNSGAGQYTSIPINLSPFFDNYKTIPSMQSFSIKADATSSSASLALNYNRLVYSLANANGITYEKNHAPRRAGEDEEIPEMEKPDMMKLYVSGESGYRDMVWLVVREDFTDGFEDGWEAEKMYGEDAAPQMYALSQAGEMSIDAIANMEGTVIAFRKGTEDTNYTFSFNYDGDGIWYLNDLKEQTSTLISELDTYTFTSMAGDNAARFVISHTPIANTPTAIENGGAIDGANVRKLMIDGTLYIIRGGQMFTADGQVVK